MSYHLAADRTKHYKYAIRNIVSEAKKVESQGRTVSYLNIGDPPKYNFYPPNDLIEAYKEAITFKLAEYSPSAGILEARLAISEKLYSKGIVTNEKSIFITDGASEAADIAYCAILNEGDEVLVPSPGYPLYNALGNKVGARQIFYDQDPDSDWAIDTDKLESQVTPRTKVLVIINPNNPTGNVHSKKTVLSLINIAKKHNLIIITDEVYSEMVFDDQHIPVASLVNKDIPVFTLESMSKNFLAPGWRLGWAAITNANLIPEICEAVLKLADARLCANTPAQYTIKPAMQMSSSYFNANLKRLRKQRDITFKMINDIPHISCNKPQGTFYAFGKADIQALGFSSDQDFILDLLRQTGILFVPGSGFGMKPEDGFFRVVFLPEEKILKSVYQKFKGYILYISEKSNILV